MKKTGFTLIIAFMMAISAAMNIACAATNQTTKQTKMGTASMAAPNITVEIKTNHGTIVLELNADKAPVTVENFVRYAKDGFYDGTIFHRVIPGFMIQGGGFKPDMSQKSPGKPIKNEADNGLKNDIGTIAMARTNDPHSATSQFFINTKNNASLNQTVPTGNGWGYCVFGKVTDGLDVVKAIEGVKTGSKGGHADVPLEDVIIENVTIVEK